VDSSGGNTNANESAGSNPRLKKEGWIEVNQEGSHKQFKYPTRIGKITVPDGSNDLKSGTEHNIRKMAGWK